MKGTSPDKKKAMDMQNGGYFDIAKQTTITPKNKPAEINQFIN
jgi:hypothetical protein